VSPSAGVGEGPGGEGLDRFVAAQDEGAAFARALAELGAGEKRSHWMWFVFPQLAGLGVSPTSRRFAIASLAEARAYLAHPVLGERLREAARAMLAVDGRAAAEVLGSLDARKLCSSMTLFHRAAPDEPVFRDVLAHYFDGEVDARTDVLLSTER
jgi:uncharacterized protein (DUF1810 family)